MGETPSAPKGQQSLFLPAVSNFTLSPVVAILRRALHFLAETSLDLQEARTARNPGLSSSFSQASPQMKYW